MLRQRKPLMRKTPLRSKSGLKLSSMKRAKPMKRKGRKPRTTEQKEYHAKVRSLGCIVSGKRPAAIHHVTEGLGMGQSVNHWRVLPLHYDYHQSKSAGAISFHGTPKEFREKYGTELELEQKLKELIDAKY